MWEHKHSDDSCTNYSDVFGQTWKQEYTDWIISARVWRGQNPASLTVQVMEGQFPPCLVFKWFFFLTVMFFTIYPAVSEISWEWNASHQKTLLLLYWKLSHLLLPVSAECYLITRLPKVAKRSTLFITIKVRGWGIEEPTTLKEDQ